MWQWLGCRAVPKWDPYGGARLALDRFIAVNESGKWSADAIESAVARDGIRVRAAYHRGAHLPDRIELAQWWSDHLEVMRDGVAVVPLINRK